MQNLFFNKGSNIVAAIQMCSSPVISENLLFVERLIYEAAYNNAQLVVLPEMFAMIGVRPEDQLIVKEKFGSGPIQQFLSIQSKKNKIWIIAGTSPIEGKDPRKIRASSLVFNEYGDCVARYDKNHMFDVVVSEKEIYRESEITEPGDDIVVVDTPVGRVGLGVCYDIRFPELFRRLFESKIDIIALPAAFTEITGQAHWELLSRARAVENFCYFVGSNQGGSHANGRKTYGNSIIVEPWGNVVAKKNGIGSGIIYANIDLTRVGSLMVPR